MTDSTRMFIGRSRELAMLAKALADHRVVQIVGLPSAGKTALALAACEVLPTVVVWCDPETTAFNVDSEYVCVDGADGLTDDAVGALRRGIATSTHRWIVTSRRRLDLPDAAVLPLGNLPFDGPESEAVELLERLLSRVGRTPDRLALAGVARQVEGSIRGLRLMAEMIELVGVDVALERVRSSGLPALEEDIEQALESLDRAGQQALADAAVFAEPFDAEAFMAVTEADLATMRTLLNCALLESTGDESPPRFLVRRQVGDVAARKSGSGRTAAFDRHAAWAIVGGGRPELVAVARRAAAGQLTDATVGISAVGKLSGGPQPPVELVDAAIDIGHEVGHGEGWFEVLCARAHIALRRSEVAYATELVELAAAAAESNHRVALQNLRASVARVTSTPEAAVAAYEALGAAEDPAAHVLLNHAAALWESGAREQARRVTEHALRQAETEGDGRRVGIIASNLGVMAHNAGEFTEAEELHGRALTLHREHGNRRYEGITLFDQGALNHELGRLRTARQSHTEALAILRELDEQRLAGLAAAALAAVEAQLGIELGHDVAAIGDRYQRAGDATFAEAVELYGRIIDVIQANDVEPPRFDASSFDARSDELQVPARILQHLTDALGDGTTLWVADGQPHVRLGPDTIQLGTREAYRAIVANLVERRLTDGTTIDVEQMVAVGWPGEIIAPEAARNRAHVALSSLRKLGLKPVLETRDRGYALSAETTIIVTS